LERLSRDARRDNSAIVSRPWVPTSGADAIGRLGFAHDVDTGRLEQVGRPGSMGLL
jgi:hypothetical protein